MKRPRYADAGAMDIGNLPGVRSWFMGNGNFELGFQRNMTISGALRTDIAKIYGARQQQFTGSEFRFDVWKIPHEGLYFWILSAKTKGTTIEVESPAIWKPTDEDRVISFLESFYAELKELEKSEDEQ